MSGDDFIKELTEIAKASQSKVKRTGFSIDKEVLEEFNRISRAKGYNKSKIIENFMVKFIEREKNLLK